MTERLESTVRPALVLMAGRLVATAATFLLPVVLVRVFDPAGFGTYKQLFLVYVVLYQAGVVFSETLFYFLPRSADRAGQYVANAVVALSAAGLGGLALLWAGAPVIGTWLGNPELSPHLPRIGLFLAMMLPAASLETVLVARKSFRWAAWSFAASDVTRALVLVALAVTVRRLDALLLGAIACAGVRLCAALWYFRREFGGALRPRAALFRTQLVYVLPFALAVIVDLVQVNYHNYAVSSRFDAATFAVYAVGCFQIPLIELVASPMCNVMMVRITEGLRDGRGDDALRVWSGTSRALALLFLPLTALMVTAAPDLIVFLFSERYRASVPIFMVWSLSIALSVLQTDGVLRAHGATRCLLGLSAARLVVTAVSIGAALSRWGLLGAVVVTIAVAAAAKAASLVRFAQLMRVGFARVLPWRQIAVIAALAAAAAVPAGALRSSVAASPAGGLVVTGLVYAACYAALLFQFGVLTDGERRALGARFQRWPVAAPAAPTRS